MHDWTHGWAFHQYRPTDFSNALWDTTQPVFTIYSTQ